MQLKLDCQISIVKVVLKVHKTLPINSWCTDHFKSYSKSEAVSFSVRVKGYYRIP